jgi:hypothetical protein
MTEGEKEQTKLTANYFNGAAIAILAIGGLAPVVALTSTKPLLPVLLVSVICILFSFGIHLLARGLLRELDK